jgi:hypothetical protein
VQFARCRLIAFLKLQLVESIAFLIGEYISRVAFEPRDSMDKAIEATCDDVFNNKVKMSKKSETTFATKYLMHFITEVLLKDANGLEMEIEI